MQTKYRYDREIWTVNLKITLKGNYPNFGKLCFGHSKTQRELKKIIYHVTQILLSPSLKKCNPHTREYRILQNN